MHLYSLTIQKPGAISRVAYGNFSSPKAQELVIVRGHILEIYQQDESGKLILLHSQEAFGLIRTISPFRLTGTSRDYLIIGSDSGRVVI